MAFTKSSGISANTRVISCLVVLGALYFIALGWLPSYPAFGDDSSVYLVSAGALAQGSGYRMVNFLTAPIADIYPIGYPALLSLFMHKTPIDSVEIMGCRCISVITCLAFVGASYLLLRKYAGETVALWVAAAVGLAPVLFQYSGMIMSECPFALLVTLAVLLAERSVREAESTSRIPAAIVLSGVCAGGSMLVRTVGFTIVLGILTALALRGQWRKLLPFGLAAAVVVAPWLIWSAAHKGGTFTTYTDWTVSKFSWMSILTNIRILAGRFVVNMLFPPAGNPTIQQLLSRAHLKVVLELLALAVSAISLLGLARMLVRRDVAAICVTFYVIVILLVPWEPTRYLVPVLPLLALLPMEGVKALLARWRTDRKAIDQVRKVLMACLAVNVLAGAAIDGLWIYNQWVYHHPAGLESAHTWEQTSAGLAWIRQNVPADALILTSYPYATYLFTGRKTIAQFPAVEIGKSIAEGRGKGPVYVFATERHYGPQEVGLAPVRKFIARKPGALIRLWTSPDHAQEVYRVSDSK